MTTNTNTQLQQNHILERILNWNMDPIMEFVAKEYPELSAKVLEQSLEEYRYYMFLIIVTKKELHIPTKVVDFIWHAHILHTRDYYNFCMNVAGNFIHHIPYPHSDEKHEQNTHYIQDLSVEYIGKPVFNFSTQNLVPVISFSSAGSSL